MTMNWSDEVLMAYADGELEGQQRADLERALAGHTALRERVAMLQAQRERLSAAYAPVLDEPMPERLAKLLRPPSAPSVAAPVLDLGQARTAARGRQQRAPSWAQWGGIAASVLVGVLLGLQWSNRSDGGGTDAAIGLRDGRLVAGGAVAQALSSQLASEALPGAPVAVQLSFVDQGGRYCRTFSTAAVAGLACRDGVQWALQNVVAAESALSGAVRPAASGLPRALLDAVDQRIAGITLDAAGERQARDRGWQR